MTFDDLVAVAADNPASLPPLQVAPRRQPLIASILKYVAFSLFGLALVLVIYYDNIKIRDLRVQRVDAEEQLHKARVIDTCISRLATQASSLNATILEDIVDQAQAGLDPEAKKAIVLDAKRAADQLRVVQAERDHATEQAAAGGVPDICVQAPPEGGS